MPGIDTKKFQRNQLVMVIFMALIMPTIYFWYSGEDPLYHLGLSDPMQKKFRMPGNYTCVLKKGTYLPHGCFQWPSQGLKSKGSTPYTLEISNSSNQRITYFDSKKDTRFLQGKIEGTDHREGFAAYPFKIVQDGVYNISTTSENDQKFILVMLILPPGKKADRSWAIIQGHELDKDKFETR